MEKQTKKIHYAWYILACCFLINFIVQSIVMQLSNLYIVPMYNDLQVPRTLLSLQSICITVGAVVTAPYWGKLYKTKDARKLLPMAVSVVALCTIARYTYDRKRQKESAKCHHLSFYMHEQRSPPIHSHKLSASHRSQHIFPVPQEEFPP